MSVLNGLYGNGMTGVTNELTSTNFLQIVTTSGKNFLGDYLELKNHMDHGTDIDRLHKKLTVFKSGARKRLNCVNHCAAVSKYPQIKS